MGDIDSTLAVSIKDELSGNDAIINTSGELKAISQISDGTDTVDIYTGDDGAKRLQTDAYTSPFPKGFRDVANHNRKLELSSKGTYNVLYTRPQLFTEGVFVTDGIRVTGSSTTVTELQIFKASVNNITELLGSLRSSNTATTIDDFNGDVTTNWTSSNNGQLIRTEDTTIKYEGTSSMKLEMRPSATEEYAYNSTTAQDYSGVDSFAIWHYGDSLTARWAIELEDSSGYLYRSQSFGVNALTTWEKKILDKLQFTEQQVNPTDLTDIVSVRIVCVTVDSNNDGWFDLFEYEELDTSTITIKMYDFGTTSAPTNLSDGTLMEFDDGSDATFTFSTELPQRVVQTIPFPIGVTNESNEMTVGNYYGLYVQSQYADLWGNSTKTYQNGDAYTVNTGTGALTGLSETMYFGIYSCPPEYSINHHHIFSDDNLLASEIWSTLMDENGSVKASLINNWIIGANSTAAFHQTDHEVYDKRDIWRFTVLDDGSNTASFINYNIEFAYADFERYG